MGDRLTKEQIKEVMEQPKTQALIPMYKKIWKQATGKEFEGCNCRGNFQRLYKLCYNYYKNNFKLKTI